MASNPYQAPELAPKSAKPHMICQVCGVEAPTKHVAFMQNIGAVFMRFHKSIDGNLCKRCIHSHFYSMTGTTLLLGWWGTISFCVTPFFVLNNVGRYLFCLMMPPVPKGAMVPVLTDDSVAKIGPHTQELIARLNKGEKFDQVMITIAEIAGVSPAQVILYIRRLIAAQQSQQRRR